MGRRWRVARRMRGTFIPSRKRHLDERAMFPAARQIRKESEDRHLPAILLPKSFDRAIDQRWIFHPLRMSIRPFAAHVATRIAGGQLNFVVRFEPLHLDRRAVGDRIEFAIGPGYPDWPGHAVAVAAKRHEADVAL